MVQHTVVHEFCSASFFLVRVHRHFLQPVMLDKTQDCGGCTIIPIHFLVSTNAQGLDRLLCSSPTTELLHGADDCFRKLRLPFESSSRQR